MTDQDIAYVPTKLFQRSLLETKIYEERYVNKIDGSSVIAVRYTRARCSYIYRHLTPKPYMIQSSGEHHLFESSICFMLRTGQTTFDTCEVGDWIIVHPETRNVIHCCKNHVFEKLYETEQWIVERGSYPVIVVDPEIRSLLAEKKNKENTTMSKDTKPNNDNYNKAKAAYERYGRSTDFKNYQGNPMPKFEDLGDAITLAWIEAVTGLVEEENVIPANENIVVKDKILSALEILENTNVRSRYKSLVATHLEIAESFIDREIVNSASNEA